MLLLKTARILASLGFLCDLYCFSGQEAPPTWLAKQLEQAQVYLDQQKYTDAARELRSAISIHPQIRGAYYQLGFALFQINQFAEAEKAFLKELDFPPPDPYSLYYLGRIRLDAGQRLKAIAYFERSLAAGEILDVRQRLAGSYLALGRLDQTMRFLEESVRIRPEDGGLHYLLGRAYKQKGKDAPARSEFDAAVRWKRKSRTEMESLTRLHQALAANNEKDAVAVTGLLANSSDADVLLAAGITIGEAGLHQEAVPFLEKSTRLQPNLAEAHYNLGHAYMLLKNPKKAQPEFQRATDLRPGLYEAEALLGTLLAEAGNSEQAIKHLRAAVQVRSDNPRMLMLLGLQYFQQRYYPDAIEVLDKSLQLDPKNPEPRFLLIQAHYRNLEYERALSLAQQTLQMFPDNALAHYHLGAQYNNLGRLSEAKEQLEAALVIDPKILEARVMLGDVLFKLGKPEESIALLRQVLSEDARLMEAHAGIGKALIQLKQFPQAATAMEQAIHIDGKLASLHLYLSQAYRAIGRAEEAKKESETFSHLNQERAKARDQDVERKYMELDGSR